MSDTKKPDTLVGVLLELMAFVNTIKARETPLTGAESMRQGQLMSRLRALDAA